ncbi:MAG: hypothetical protein ACREUQ_10910 [Burkholderiales bacterium]
MSSATGASDRSGLRGLLRALAVVAAFVAFQLLAHRLVGRGEASRSLLWLALLPQIAVYAFLLWFFGRTLLSGGEALITRLARSVHGELPLEIAHYTRRVTAYWCAVFTLMAAASAALFVFAPIRTWSLFANVLNLPLIALAFVGEYGWRILRYPRFSHVSLLGTLRAFHRFRRASRAE